MGLLYSDGCHRNRFDSLFNRSQFGKYEAPGCSCHGLYTLGVRFERVSGESSRDHRREERTEYTGRGRQGQNREEPSEQSRSGYRRTGKHPLLRYGVRAIF